ncbi:MAG: MiaB/RimO family radical SAM methylthiotransferase [Coriobacteriia bacterium]|nr:MiaB/RimO family radical SAM methylthiotransferase [Coriobacteriia bacterium]
MNRADGDELLGCLLSAGAIPAPPAEAGLNIVMTCVVTKEAEQKTRKAINRLLLENKQAPVLVVGCAVAVNEQLYQSADERVYLAKQAEPAKGIALQLLGLGQEAVPVSGRTPAVKPADRQRYNLKIQDGCDSECSFCVVRIARGKSRSRALDDVVSEASLAEAAGWREIVLTGINLGSYRIGEDSGPGLPTLLWALLANTRHSRFRLSSIEPMDVSDHLVDLIAGSKGRICAHLHMPLQSGSDRVLQMMNRPYTSGQFASRVAYARERLPQLALSSDLIVGFPGETEADFLSTYELCREMSFMRMHVFRFSPRDKTTAATMPNQLDEATKSRRSAKLRKLADELTGLDLQKRVGTSELVLVERAGLGRSESYHLVRLPDDLEVGSLSSVRFSGYTDKLLEC